MLAVLPKSSPDCIVGLSPFMPDAELRLLPACRRVFHAACIDAWLRTSPTCPLCPSCSRLPRPSTSAIVAVEQPPPRSEDCFRAEISSSITAGGLLSPTDGDEEK
jgi:E3 ubiquitin-protein ligase ATL4